MVPNGKGRPLIGILTTANQRGTFSGNRQNFRDLSMAAYRLGGRVFVFTPEGIDEKHRRILGFRYDPKKRCWLKVRMPFPDVVYNRIPRRADEHKPHVQQALGKLQQWHIPLFNPAFFNKWELYRWLRDEPELSRHLPVTCRFSWEALHTMFKAHGALYLKPVYGKAGIHFYKIEPVNTGIQLTHQLYGRQKRTVFPDWKALHRHLSLHIPKRPYIIQQAIPLTTYQGRPFDLRLLVQKNGHGQWAVTGVGARLAGPQAITTHVPQGGFIISPETGLAAFFGPQQADAILKAVRKLALHVAQSLEARCGLLGELSMDIGIDRTGQPWFFEANAKPMKFDEPHIRKMSIRRFFEYCHYLSRTAKKEFST